MRPDTTYSGTITGAAWVQARKGTPGLQVDLEAEDGQGISHVWWLTHKTKETFEGEMKEFGIKPEQLASGSFLQNELFSVLIGKDVTFATKEEEYQGTKKVKVHWINAGKAPSDPRGIGFAVASLFGGEVSEDDIPF